MRGVEESNTRIILAKISSVEQKKIMKHKEKQESHIYMGEK